MMTAVRWEIRDEFLRALVEAQAAECGIADVEAYAEQLLRGAAELRAAELRGVREREERA